MVLHGNTHDKQILIRRTALIAVNDFFIQFPVGDIFPQNLRLVKIVDKMCLIKPEIRIHRVAAPSGLIVRMHCHTGIAVVL